jgi:hypothetical protein
MNTENTTPEIELKTLTFYQLMEAGRAYAGNPSLAKLVKQEQSRRRRNAFRREQNEILRDMCGTSARAAREDMGLAKG